MWRERSGSTDRKRRERKKGRRGVEVRSCDVLLFCSGQRVISLIVLSCRNPLSGRCCELSVGFNLMATWMPLNSGGLLCTFVCVRGPLCLGQCVYMCACIRESEIVWLLVWILLVFECVNLKENVNIYLHKATGFSISVRITMQVYMCAYVRFVPTARSWIASDSDFFHHVFVFRKRRKMASFNWDSMV